jgi:hypothetical protein
MILYQLLYELQHTVSATVSATVPLPTTHILLHGIIGKQFKSDLNIDYIGIKTWD